MRVFAALPALLLALAPAVYAAGSDESAPPEPTETTRHCKNGQIYDTTRKACVDPQSGSLSDDLRFDALRELAAAGRYDEAAIVLAAMREAGSDRVLTYRGFLLRKSGRIEAGIQAYEAALRLNPGNLLANSYYGQLLVEMDELAAARAHLTAIRSQGGSGSWAETSLARAIETGLTYNF